MSDATPQPEPPAGAGPPPFMGGPAVAGARVADEADRPSPPVGPAKGRRTKRTIIEWVAVLVVAVLAALLLRTFVIQPYFIPSGSMEPTLEIGDKVLVDKLSYHLHSVHRGDVIVFKRPPNYTDPGVKDLIKRVIGLPGETISAQGGQVYINGKLLPEPWLPKEYAFTANFGPVHIPPGDYFVMGDHRGDSDDSRFGLGPISGKLIVGRAFLIVWPIGHIGTL